MHGPLAFAKPISEVLSGMRKYQDTGDKGVSALLVPCIFSLQRLASG